MTSTLRYSVEGDGVPVLMVHGNVMPGPLAWAEQRPLAARWRLVTIERPGYGDEPAESREDFEADASALAALLGRARQLWGTIRVHLVGNSYGAVIAMLAAAARPEAVASLTLIEPAAFAVARHHAAVRALEAGIADLHREAATLDDRAFLSRFVALVGGRAPIPDPLPLPLVRGAARLRDQRRPGEAAIPLARLAAARFPKLVISGGHDEAFTAIADALETGLEAERAIITGAGHGVQLAGDPFNARLDAFLDVADAMRRLDLSAMAMSG